MLQNPEVWALVGTVAVALAAIIVGGVKFVVKQVDAIVKASETKVDDKIWKATKAGLREALDELAAEAQSEVDAGK